MAIWELLNGSAKDSLRTHRAVWQVPKEQWNSMEMGMQTGHFEFKFWIVLYILVSSLWPGTHPVQWQSFLMKLWIVCGQVMFDTTKHFSEGAIRRRNQERLKLQELEEERKKIKRDEEEAARWGDQEGFSLLMCGFIPSGEWLCLIGNTEVGVAGIGTDWKTLWKPTVF